MNHFLSIALMVTTLGFAACDKPTVVPEVLPETVPVPGEKGEPGVQGSPGVQGAPGKESRDTTVIAVPPETTTTPSDTTTAPN